MTHLDLFSGIGGFALAANRCGYETVGFVERDEFCKRVLRKHWPSVPIFDHIHDFDGTQFKGVKLLTGGFPCQPYSQAGLKRGASDDRAIWPQMLRVITEARPSYIVGENVVGIVNMELDDVLDSLESENYAAQTFIIPACAVDARHRRDRVWILGADAMVDPDETSRQRQRSSQGSGQSGKQHQSRHDIDGDGETLAHTERNRQSRSGEPGDAGNQKAHCKRQTIESFNGSFRQVWPTEPDVGRVAYGVPERAHRLRGLGNAIVPQIAEEIIKAIPK
jgi:DNA (cytosine-5)-methyltransferase 1